MKHLYAVGDLVYFHAFADMSDNTTYFMCKGYITRQPKEESKVYKIIIISVDPKSVLCGEKPDIAQVLLGKKVALKGYKLTREPTDWMHKFYGDQEWIDLKGDELDKVKRYIKKKQKG